MLSHMMYNNSPWYKEIVIKRTCQTINNIQRKNGYSPLEIITYHLQGERNKLREIRSQNRNRDAEEDVRSKFERNDIVRIRIAKNPGKIDFTHKSHLGFEGSSYIKPVNWSLRKYQIEKVKHYRKLRKFSYKLNDGKWYDAYELLKVPPNSERVVRKLPELRPDRRLQVRAKNIPR